jgi:hypothetical protein
LATCQPTFMHDGTVLTQANFGVSDTRSSLPANQDISLRIDTNIGDGVGSNVDELPVTVHGLFRANSSGTYEYFLLSYLFSGTITLNDVQLTAVFFPTNYGSVSPTLAEGPQPLGDESKGVRAEERLGAPSPSPSAEEVYMARIEGEMAAMRAELEALKQELQNGNRRED